MTFSVAISTQTSINIDPALQTSQVKILINIISVTGFVDKGLFVYAIDTVTGVPYFSYVATPGDLTSYYYNANGTNNFVRKDNLTVLRDTGDAATTFIADITAALQLLCDDMKLLTQYTTPVVVTITAV